MEAASIACTLARASACSGTALRRNGADSGTLRGASQSRVKSYSPLSPVLSRTGRPRSSDNGPTSAAGETRSEERRVGKECRSGRSTEHEKKREKRPERDEAGRMGNGGRT